MGSCPSLSTPAPLESVLMLRPPALSPPPVHLSRFSKGQFCPAAFTPVVSTWHPPPHPSCRSQLKAPLLLASLTPGPST